MRAFSKIAFGNGSNFEDLAIRWYVSHSEGSKPKPGPFVNV